MITVGARASGNALLWINLGCGALAEDGWVNVDAAQLPGVDVVHDLEQFPWPFEDSTAERIKAYDVLEHICPGNAFLALTAEIHRVLAPGGELWVRWPHYGTHSAHTDPTHIRFPTLDTFGYWVKGHPLNDKYGRAYARGCHFDQVSLTQDGDNIVTRLRKI